MLLVGLVLAPIRRDEDIDDTSLVWVVTDEPAAVLLGVTKLRQGLGQARIGGIG
jgi:hypothetical protein